MSADVTDCGITLGRRVSGSRKRLYASLEEVVLAVAPPRTGKTAWLGGTIIDAPGACVATSTKADIYQHTARLREANKGPLYVFNPEGLGGIESNLRWSPITGCHYPQIAMQRAGYLLAGSPGASGTDDRNFWEGSSFKVLRCFLYAAAVGERDMAELTRWVNDPADRSALKILERHGATPRGWAEDLAQIVDSGSTKTRDSIFLALSLTFEFMADPALARAVTPEPGAKTFNVKRFLREKGTLYLLASERPYGTLAPLFTALTGHIFDAAKHYADTGEHLGRLDPPLLMALDEAALICPVPLERWTSDGGSRSIPLLICVQSPSQLYDRWGHQAGKTIWSNAAIKLIFGGLTVSEHLKELSDLCGDRDEVQRTHMSGGDGRKSTTTSTRRVPVVSVSDIRMLPTLQALLIHRNIGPVMTRITPVWRRDDVRRAAKAGTVARPQPVEVERRPRRRRRGEKLAEVVQLHPESTGVGAEQVEPAEVAGSS